MDSEKNKRTDYSKLISDTFQTPEKDVISIEDGLDEWEYRQKVRKGFFKDKKHEIKVGIVFGIFVLNTVISVLRLLYAIYKLDTAVLPENIFWYLLCILLPFGLWIWSTKYNFYNFHDRKLRLMYFCIINGAIQIAQMLYIILAGILMPAFALIPVNKDITIGMVFNLARFIMAIVSVLPSILLIKGLISATNHPITQNNILSFKLNKQFDLRDKDSKEFAYDMDIVKNLKTGERHVIKEKDRYLHAVANGTTGTGKTSSCFTCAIANDIDKIVHNKEYQKRECKKLLDAGRIRMIKPMDDIDFNIDNFEETNEKDKNDKLLEKLKFKAKIAGISAMAPNASFADEIYALATSKGLKVNRIDPTFDIKTGRLKPGFKGFNPLYIKPDLELTDYISEVNLKAQLFADVAQAIYDSEGASDVYFASLNKQVTTTVSQLVLFTYPKMHNGKQATVEDVQMVLNDFSKAEKYQDCFIEEYGKRNENDDIIYENGKPLMSLPLFQQIYDFVSSELLGDGAEKMTDQCRGLRVIINTLLTNLNVKNVLCSNDSVDLREALEEGQITLVNYALELGSSGKALGLFYMLSFINAVYRRPGNEDTRIPHFCYIDEFPVLLHPSMDACFSLFRQYRIAMFVAIQSLSQMDKTQSTAFMKPVLQGNCAHHFVFGRVAPEEMDMYEKMAGKVNKITEMTGITETSLTVENPTISTNRREQMALENRIEGGDIRSRDFQEVTVVTVDNGSPIDMFFGKVSFLPKYRRLKRKGYVVNWSKYPTVVKATVNVDTNKEDTKKSDDAIEISRKNSMSSVGGLMHTTASDVFTDKKENASEKNEENLPEFLKMKTNNKKDENKTVESPNDASKPESQSSSDKNDVAENADTQDEDDDETFEIDGDSLNF